MGDYGGTHTMFNSNQNKSRQQIYLTDQNNLPNGLVSNNTLSFQTQGTNRNLISGNQALTTMGTTEQLTIAQSKRNANNTLLVTAQKTLTDATSLSKHASITQTVQKQSAKETPALTMNNKTNNKRILIAQSKQTGTGSKTISVQKQVNSRG